MAQIYLKLPEFTPPDLQRFWAKVEKGEPDACWNWTAGKDYDGYGCFTIKRKRDKWQLRAHRIAYFLHHNEDPWPLQVRHLVCDNPSCCNGAHLAKGTPEENRQDCVDKNRQAKGERHNLFLHPELIKRGEDSPFSKLTEREVIAIRVLHEKGFNYPKIAAIFNVDLTNIYCIVKRKTWKHI